MRAWNSLQEGFDHITGPPFYRTDIVRRDYSLQGPVKEDYVCIAGGGLRFTHLHVPSLIFLQLWIADVYSHTRQFDSLTCCDTRC